MKKFENKPRLRLIFILPAVFMIFRLLYNQIHPVTVICSLVMLFFIYLILIKADILMPQRKNILNNFKFDLLCIALLVEFIYAIIKFIK